MNIKKEINLIDLSDPITTNVNSNSNISSNKKEIGTSVMGDAIISKLK